MDYTKQLAVYQLAMQRLSQHHRKLLIKCHNC